MFDLGSALITIFGLAIFEVLIAIDNAVVNAHVLSTMSDKGKRWFLFWGLLFAVFVVRGVLPWMIVFALNPQLGLFGSLTLAFSDDPAVAASLAQSEGILLVGGGVFLVFLFFHWLFMETKHYGLELEKQFERHGAWFYAIVSVLLLLVVYFALERNPLMALGATAGSTLFFITHGFKTYAEEKERNLVAHGSAVSDWSKIFYLEAIDTAFSVDSVLGSFAFTLSVPLMLIGNGIGALVVRQLTIGNIERVKKYKYLKNGAMYSVFFLGCVMLADSFGAHIPQWLSPLVTLSVLAFFFYKSHRELKTTLAASTAKT